MYLTLALKKNDQISSYIRGILQIKYAGSFQRDSVKFVNLLHVKRLLW